MEVGTVILSSAGVAVVDGLFRPDPEVTIIGEPLEKWD